MKYFETNLLGYEIFLDQQSLTFLSNFDGKGVLFLIFFFPAQPWWAAILRMEGTAGVPPKVGTKFKTNFLDFSRGNQPTRTLWIGV